MVERKDAAEAALNRRSVRKYKAEPVPRELLDTVLRLAGRAPSAWNLQPWRWHVVAEADLKQRLMGAAFGQPQVGAASAVIVVASDMEDALKQVIETRHSSFPQDSQENQSQQILDFFRDQSIPERGMWGRNQSNIALGYLLLLLEVHGIASSPMLGFDPGQVRELLQLPEHVEIPALVAIGWGDEDGLPPERLDLDQLRTWH